MIYQENKNPIVETETNKFLINDENFLKLKQLQQRIYYETEVSPSIRKLINSIITEDNLNQLEEILLKQLKFI